MVIAYMSRSARCVKAALHPKLAHQRPVGTDKKGSKRMRGMIGGILTGCVVSAVGLGTASVVSELPAGTTPPKAPLIEAPMADPVAANGVLESNLSTPVGSVSIVEPQAPELPVGEAAIFEPDVPQQSTPEAEAPRADTDPLAEPEVLSIDGAMTAPDIPENAIVLTQPVDPVLPNPQSLAPETPMSEADLTILTTPAQPTVIVEVEADEGVVATDKPVGSDVSESPADDTFVVDLGADAPQVQPADEVLAAVSPNAELTVGPRLQLQGGDNTLLGDRATGVTIRRPVGDDTAAPEEMETTAQMNALVDFAAASGDAQSKPLLSIVLIDDGSMSAAAAALAGLSFPVTIALDPGQDNAADLMQQYREDGFEVAVIAKLPEGAVPSDVEVTFESVFKTLPETIAVLDIGEAGLQLDRGVTDQAMNILASQGRGFVTVSQGLNMAGRAAEQAGVPAVVVYRDLDKDDQDARVVRRFVDQAAFRARQESGVVLVGRVRADTISALILWGSANQDDQIAIVPLSAVLNAQ
jgi:polysaccharide deacetylase 2 family uncharacterized protein YibQ